MRKLLSSTRLALTRGLVAVGILAGVTVGGLPGGDLRMARADEPMVKYLGLHPLSPHQGEFCYIDAAHYHRFVPVDRRVYVTLADGAQLYVGDPAWLGYDGPRVGYFGPHPLAVPLAPEAGPLHCYITRPHYHAAAPPPSPQMVLKDGVYWYLGPPPPADVQRAWINEVHTIKAYVPPHVDLSAAPSGYRVLHVGEDPPASSAAAPAGPGAGGAAGSAGSKAQKPAAPRPTRPAAAGTPAAAPGMPR